MRRPAARARAAGLVLLGILAASCAKVAPPPGGPEDRDPPEIVEALPPRGASGVAPDSTLMILFSEEPDRRSVLRALTVYPPAEFARTEWAGPILRMTPGEPWSADRPTLVILAGTARDRRGNELGEPFRWRFWTRDAADSGVATGKVWPGKEVPRGQGVVVTAYLAADSLDPESADPVAVVETHSDGGFRIDGLDTAREYRMIALLDRNDDGRPGERGEIWQEAPERIRFPAPDSLEVRLPDFLLGTLDSTGFLDGEVAADSAAPAVVFTVSGADTIRQALDGGGPFSLEVPTGRTYGLSAFLDLDGDAAPGAAEPIVAHDGELPLVLTARQTGIRFDLTGLGPAPPPEPPAPPEPAEGSPELPGGSPESPEESP